MRVNLSVPLMHHDPSNLNHKSLRLARMVLLEDLEPLDNLKQEVSVGQPSLSLNWISI